MPGTMRNNSGMVVAPERSIISGVMTNTAAADCPRVLSVREIVVTSMSINCARLNFLNSSTFPVADTE